MHTVRNPAVVLVIHERERVEFQDALFHALTGMEKLIDRARNEADVQTYVTARSILQGLHNAMERAR